MCHLILEMAPKSWIPWYMKVTEKHDKKTTMLQCNLCHWTFAKKLEQQLSHLGYEQAPSKRNSGIGLCTKLPSRVKSLFKNCGGHYPSYNRELELTHSTFSTMKTISTYDFVVFKSTNISSCVRSTQLPTILFGMEKV